MGIQRIKQIINKSNIFLILCVFPDDNKYWTGGRKSIIIKFVLFYVMNVVFIMFYIFSRGVFPIFINHLFN